MRLVTVLMAVAPLTAQCQTRTIRIWFGYGDEATAQRARASGIDPLAEVGREISGSRLAVPTNGQDFKVGLWCEMNASDGQARYGGGPSVNIAFDRTYCGQYNQNPPLNADSFRKVRPAGANQNNYIEAFTNGAIVPAWQNASTPADWDNNGVQDTAQIGYMQTLPSAWRQGTQADPSWSETLRPVGLATYLTANLIDGPYAGGGQGFKLPNATPFRIIDVNWVSMLAAGETYGDHAGETGLSITTSSQIGLSNTTAIVGSASHIGSCYTLVAVVPEPGSLVALGFGALALLRRRCT